MDIIITIIAIVFTIWLVLFIFSFTGSLLGALLSILEEQLIPIIVCAVIGYGIEYLCKSWFGISTLFDIHIFFYPIILYAVYYILDNLGNLLNQIWKIFKDSLDVSDAFKSSSKQQSKNKTKTRYDSSSGTYVYQDGDTLTDSQGNTYHKDGDNKWRDFKGNCIDDNDLSRN